jgi:Cytochrome c554 and c-prime
MNDSVNNRHFEQQPSAVPMTSFWSCWHIGAIGGVVSLLAAALYVNELAIAAGADQFAQVVTSADVSGGGKRDFDQGKKGEVRSYYGVDSCTDCHTKGFTNPNANICLGNEVKTWQEEDKHKLAYTVLGEERGQRMGKALNWDVKNKKECLICHSVWVDEKPGVIAKAPNLRREEGVSCAACHGPDIVVLPGQGTEPKLGWVDTHGSQNALFRDAWRGLSREIKEADWGMRDLWDAAKRTKLCTSCHIGNAQQGKVVTHEMYAAGHPPLPSFEVVTFCNQMPRHWKNLNEKSPEVLALAKKNFNVKEVEREQVHLLTVGGLTAFQEYLSLLAAPRTTNEWPELANYSCYACHHELKQKSWRQERGYPGKNPGRPPLHEWPAALAQLGLFHVDGDKTKSKQLVDEFNSQLMDLQGLIDAQPFGQQDAVKQKAEAMAKWIEGQIARIKDRADKGGYGSDSVAVLLAELAGLAKQSFTPGKPEGGFKHRAPDFDTARQLAWAFHDLSMGTATKQKAVKNNSNQKDAWGALDAYLGLTLPKGQVRVETSIKQAMERLGQYDPQEFRHYWEAVIEQIKSAP